MFHPKSSTNTAIGGVEGGVIMPKLGNETAKFVTITNIPSIYEWDLQSCSRTCDLEVIVSGFPPLFDAQADVRPGTR